MKNKTKRYDIALFFIFLIIMLYFLILNSIEQKHFEQNYPKIQYNNISIIDLDVKIYPTLFSNNLSSDRIVPTGSMNFIDVTILNKGPSDFCDSQLILKVCDPDCKNNDGYVLQKDNINPLKVNEKYNVLLGGHIPNKEGKWKYVFELSGDCLKNIEKGDVFEFQVISLDTYYQYKTNKDVENLTIIILFVSLITIAFSFDEVKKYTKKMIKKLTEGWFK